MKQIQSIALRMLATFAASGRGVIGAGTIAGVPLWKAIFMAGIAGVATVVEGLSRAFLDDGKLSVEEINAVFNNVDGSSRKQEFSQAIAESGMGSATASAYMAHKNA
jgi:hypothetical protein